MLLTVGCSSEALDLMEQEASASGAFLSVNALTVAPDTKDLVEGSYFPSEATIGVTVTASDGSSYEGRSYTNCPFKASGTGAGQTWTATGQTIWLTRLEGKAYAYYPYQADTDIEAIPVSGESTTDYMYAKSNGVFVHHLNPAVTFHMAHALAVVRLSIYKGEYDGVGQLVSTALQSPSFGLSATLNAKRGELTDYGGVDAERVLTAPDGTLLSTSDAFVQDYYVVPSGNSGAIQLKVAVDDLTFVTATEPVTVVAGQVYTYKVSLQAASMAISGASVTSWSYYENSTEYETNIK